MHYVVRILWGRFDEIRSMIVDENFGGYTPAELIKKRRFSREGGNLRGLWFRFRWYPMVPPIRHLPVTARLAYDTREHECARA